VAYTSNDFTCTRHRDTVDRYTVLFIIYPALLQAWPIRGVHVEWFHLHKA
jgi:hypothetical protein